MEDTTGSALSGSVELGDVVLFVAGRKAFLRTSACINCSIADFCACEGADEIFGIGEVLGRKLVDVADGVLISEPVEVPKELRREGKFFQVSISHNGVIAIYSAREDMSNSHRYKEGDGMNMVQLTDLGTGRQVEVEVEDEPLCGPTMVQLYC